ncbi:F-box protein cpr1 [Thalictrum thalictroides]|uniref:F-box protein cpr1 n=1 Tax=Thalictrum thalictroides TaxID=46969 RepID=A0A7J6XBH5_THATH|nr:F-box protein cpr1 [Thalictrum thalictroides]
MIYHDDTTYLGKSIRNIYPAGSIRNIHPGEIFSVDFDTTNNEAVEMDYPYKSCLSRATILGSSCNGIFLVGVYLRDVGPWYPYSFQRNSAIFEVLALWNPSTREFKELPDILWKFMKDRRTCGKIAYGLGYDSSMDDYKVIRILYYYNIHEAEDKIKDYESDIHVYSMRTNSYMRIPGIPYFIMRTLSQRHIINGFFSNKRHIINGIFLNGAVHWVGRRDPKTTTSEFSLRIVSFNVVNEEFEEIQMPDSFDSTTPFELGVFEGCLCIYRYNNSVGNVDGFIMNKYGADESWTNLLRIKHPQYGYPFPLMFTQIFYITESKHVHFLDRKIGLTKCGIMKIQGDLKRISLLFQIESYLGSLVSLGGRTAECSTT